MKKPLVLSSALCVLGAAAAHAQVTVTLGAPAVYESPGYTMAPDWPSEHYDIHRARHNDYWAKKQQEDRDRAAHHDDHKK